jgi:S-adenosylmethionine uptake transporter
LFGIALCYLIHSIAFFKAFKFAEMSTVMPFDYSRLVFTGILGYLVLNEVPDRYSLLGYALIVIGGMCSIFYETHRNRKIKAKKSDIEEDVAPQA